MHHAQASTASLSDIAGQQAEYLKKNVRSIFCCARGVGVCTDLSADCREQMEIRQKKRSPKAAPEK
jgi:hypothetical protein